MERRGRVQMPDGSVLAKDSFEVAHLGIVIAGPLAFMEKMEAGFSPTGGDGLFQSEFLDIGD